MTRKERKANADKKRAEIRQFYQDQLEAVMPRGGNELVTIPKLWANFCDRINLRGRANDQMALQELLIFKRDFRLAVERDTKAQEA